MKAAAFPYLARRRVLIGIAVALLVAACALFWWAGVFEREPSYQGKTASAWLDPLEDGGYSATVTDAFRAMGSDGARFLVRTFEKEPFELPESFIHFLEKLNLPEWANPLPSIEDHVGKINDRRQVALDTFRSLGSDGAPAIPMLVRMFRQSHRQESDLMAGLMIPMAGKLQFFVPELVKYLRRNKPVPSSSAEEVMLLGAIGPVAKDAVPILHEITTSPFPILAANAAASLWKITGDTNDLLKFVARSLRNHGRSPSYALSQLYFSGVEPRSLLPLLEQALRHPEPSVRHAAAKLLDKIDPRRLRQIEAELNSHQEELLRDNLRLLQSTNSLDRFNAEQALQFFGPKAVSAAPRLVEILELREKPERLDAVTGMDGPINEQFAASSALMAQGSNAGVVTPALIKLLHDPPEREVACDILAEIGPKAVAAIPTLETMMATNEVFVTNRYRGRGMGAKAPLVYKSEFLPSWKLARALASVDPRQTNAIAILRQTQIVKVPWQAPFLSAITLWKLGLETNLPLNEWSISGENGGFDCLAKIGPAAKQAVPSIESYLKRRPLSISAALALCKIDPREANRLGYPGLFIICPDKY